MAMKKDLPTVAQLAQAAGVSPATVSRVLNHKGIVKADTYNRVVAVLQAKGYPFVEKAGRADPSDVLMISLPSLDNPFYADIVRGAKSGATRHGYHLIINESHINRNTLPGILELVHSLRISGLITINHISTDILHTLSNVVPLVQCCEYNEELPFPIVSIDNYASAYNAVSHLINLGRRDIAFFGSSSASMYTVLREQGFRDAMADYGLPVNESWVLHLGDVDYNLAVSASDHLFSQPECPDAVFAVSDMYAAGVTRSARKLGLSIPEDVSVVGFDDTDVAKINEPPLTTIRQPSYKMGCFACSMLLQLISTGSTPSHKVILESELIVRDSSRAKAPISISGEHRE